MIAVGLLVSMWYFRLKFEDAILSHMSKQSMIIEYQPCNAYGYILHDHITGSGGKFMLAWLRRRHWSNPAIYG